MKDEKKTKKQLIEELVGLRKKVARFEKANIYFDQIKSRMRIVFEALNSSANGVVLTDIRGRIAYVNPSFLNIFGYDERDELIGIDAAELFVTKKVQRFFDVKNIIDRKKDISEEFLVERKDGKKIPVQVSYSNIFNKNRKLIGRMASFIDLSEEYRAKKRLRIVADKVQVLASKLVESEEIQKKLIAKELHDGVGSNLTAIKFALEENLYSSAKEGLNVSGSLEQVIAMVRDTIDEVHRVSYNLRPAVLDDVGLIPAVSSICNDFQEAQSSIRIHSCIDMEEKEIPDHLKITIFRLLQESLNNAFKHSKAKNIEVSLQRVNNHVRLAVEDNGTGFDSDRFKNSESEIDGMGLASMKERVQLSEGRFDVRSKKGRGTLIEAIWPIEDEYHRHV